MSCGCEMEMLNPVPVWRRQEPLPDAPCRGVAILGATGSIGSAAVRVCAAHPERFRVECVTGGSRLEALLAAREMCHAQDWWCAGAPTAGTITSEEALLELITGPRVDVVLCAIQGIGALRQVLAALRAGKIVALATKEVLVAAGEWVMAEAQKHGGVILPVDSEHCAIFQALQAGAPDEVRRLLLTCSGGPFHSRPEVDLHSVTPQEAMRHPTWNMGAKITLDSATLMNKALEVIEAARLYHLPGSAVEVLIHPQSIVHSMVEFRDGSIVAQLGPTDMALPIQYCLGWPQRLTPPMAPMDFNQLVHLDFRPPDLQRFPALGLAWRALEMGGLAGAVLNAANDAACKRFLEGTLAFDEIPLAVAVAMERTPAGKADSFAALEEADAVAHSAVQEFAARS